LFYKEGIRAVGVDRVASEAGVAKTTIYEHFAGKDDLVVAYLRSRDSEVRHYLEEALGKHPGPPRERLLSVFTSMGEWVTQLGFRGCGFMNAAIELGATDHPARRVVVEYKNAMLGTIV